MCGKETKRFHTEATGDNKPFWALAGQDFCTESCSAAYGQKVFVNRKRPHNGFVFICETCACHNNFPSSNILIYKYNRVRSDGVECDVCRVWIPEEETCWLEEEMNIDEKKSAESFARWWSILEKNKVNNRKKRTQYDSDLLLQ